MFFFIPFDYALILRIASTILKPVIFCLLVMIWWKKLTQFHEYVNILYLTILNDFSFLVVKLEIWNMTYSPMTASMVACKNSFLSIYLCVCVSWKIFLRVRMAIKTKSIILIFQSSQNVIWQSTSRYFLWKPGMERSTILGWYKLFFRSYLIHILKLQTRKFHNTISSIESIYMLFHYLSIFHYGINFPKVDATGIARFWGL